MKFLPQFIFWIIFLCPASALYAQWQPQASGTDANFQAVSAASRRVVWVGGTKGTFVRTTDGGKTWQAGRVPGADSLDFRDVHAVSRFQAYLMSAGPAERGQARIYRTLNGGKTWELVYETRQPGVFLDGMDFWSSRHGIAFSDPVEGKWFVIRTYNGGRSWDQIPPKRLPAMQPGEAAFAASGTSLVVDTTGRNSVWIASGGSQYGRVFQSDNGGRTWRVRETPIPAGPTSGIFGLYASGRRAMAVGGDYKQEHAATLNVAVTRNNGRTWEAATPTDPPGLKEGIGWQRRRRLVVVGPSGSCYTDDWGKTWTKIDDSAYHAIACAGGTCWAVGAKGRIGVLGKN